MTPQDITGSINAVTEALSGPSQAVVEEYTRYMFFSSAAYVALGALLAWGASRVWKHAVDEREEGYYVLAVILGLVAVAFVAFNLGDLIAPKAAAIHQLIRDIRAA